MYFIGKEKHQLLQCCQHSLQNRTLAGRNVRRDVSLKPTDRLGTSRPALHPKRRHDSPDRTTIRRVVDTLHQPVGLEPIHQLRDVGTNALELTRELAQSERLARLRQRIDRLELGRRQPDFRQRTFKTVLDAMRGFEEHDHVSPMILGFRFRRAATVGWLLHGIDSTCMSFLCQGAHPWDGVGTDS